MCIGFSVAPEALFAGDFFQRLMQQTQIDYETLQRDALLWSRV